MHKVLVGVFCLICLLTIAKAEELTGEFLVKVIGHHEAPKNGDPIILDLKHNSCFLLSVFEDGVLKVLGLSCVDSGVIRPLDIELSVDVPIEDDTSFEVSL